MKRIRVVLADDHVIVLDGLEQLFRLEPEFEVVARSTTAEAALKAVQEHRPDILVLDLVMPGHDGMWVLRELSELNLPTRTVLLTAHVEENRLVEAIRLGVWGVVLKEMAPSLLVQCIRKVASGGVWLEKEAVGRVVGKLFQGEGRPRVTLTPRELEIARMVAEGLGNRAVAERLFISEGTVKTHLHTIYEKLGVKGRMYLAAYARENGLL